ncbi:MAG: four helix bundle protein [Bacteroidota bacterium]
MVYQDLKLRTKAMAVSVIRFVKGFQRDRVAEIIGDQLIRSATSVAANYRSACRARSKADFINKLGIVEEEADESLFWLEMTQEVKIGDQDLLPALMTELNELVSIFSASRITAKAGLKAK